MFLNFFDIFMNVLNTINNHTISRILTLNNDFLTFHYLSYIRMKSLVKYYSKKIYIYFSSSNKKKICNEIIYVEYGNIKERDVILDNINVIHLNISKKIKYLLTLCIVKIEDRRNGVNYFVLKKIDENFNKLNKKVDIKLLKNEFENLETFDLSVRIAKCDDIYDFNISNIKILSVVCKINNDEFDIVLNDNKNNYCLVGNVIDKEFIFYYIKNILNKDINIDDFENSKLENFNYIINLIDDNINEVELRDNEYLLILKDSYEILRMIDKIPNM